MAAEFDGIQIQQVLSMPDTRPGREGLVRVGVRFTVDGEGPFGFELPDGQLHPGQMLREIRARAAEIRRVMLF